MNDTETTILSDLTAQQTERGLLIRGLLTAEAHELVGSLPAKWDSKAFGWWCEPTPCAAARLVTAGVDCADEIAGIAAPILKARPDVLSADDLPQPTFRVHDCWRHQLLAYHFSTAADAALLALDMGLGKTKVVCDLAWNHRFNRVLVLCPVSVTGVWRREFDRHAGGEFVVTVLDQDGTAKKAKAAGTALQRAAMTGEAAVIVVNYESAWREPLGGLLASSLWDAVVLDESHKVKSPTGRASKYVATLRRKAGMRLALTGTPMPHSPGDLFGQFRFLDPGVFGVAWTRFRQRFAVCGNPMIPQQVTGWVNQEEFGELAALLMLRITRDEAALDLPAVVHQDVPVTLNARAGRVYRELEKESLVEIEGGTITAANALVELVRLRQITSGVVGTDDKTLVRIDEAKADALAEIMDDMPAGEPLVVFCQFRSDLDTVREVAERMKRRFGEVSGRRKDLTPHSTMPEGIDVLAVQWQSGGVGIDLTRACHAVIFSPTYSGGEYEQGLARIHRPGQTRPCMYWHLTATGTVDEAVYKALQRKKDVVEAVFSFLRKGGEA